MRQVTIDGTKMQSKESGHTYLKEQLSLLGYYGSNLDALWDALNTHSEPLEIKFIHYEQMIEELGNYGEAVLKVFEDAAEENPDIIFKLV
ncbi:barstar family protein [Virgibacillus sp. YIM 98842]|uniref:barstar family protein n=1 Tax=Virgibacillus sp. YIM 98842 TaxID=2663533 RepID=UPI0013DB299E|nr:barstar family protein [Virgibacillus sp. YIM 98842]